MKKIIRGKRVHSAIILIALLVFTAKRFPDVIAQSGSDLTPTSTPKEEIQIDNSYAIKVPDIIVESIKETLSNKPNGIFEGKKYALTDINQGDDWAVISIAVIAENLPPVFEVPFSDTSLIIANKNADGSWVTAINGTQDYELLKDYLPEGMLNKDNDKSTSFWSSLVDKVHALGSGDITYLIPWGSNQWDYGQGWHQGCGSCWWGLDVGTDGSNKDVYASVGGTVGICTDSAGSANVYVTDDNHTIRYTHLDSNSLNVSSGNNIETGTLLGTLKTGTFNYDSGTGQCITSGTCGCAVQASNYGHMHWVIPTSTEFYVEGWAITYNDDTWTSGSKTIDPSGTLFSRPDAMILQNQDLNIARDFSADNGIEAGPDFTIEASNGNVDFEAGTTIELDPGFTVEDGSQFNATIR